MIVALYTSRIVLNALGVEDFGLYNVIGGVVGLFSFFRTSMEKATQRFLNVEMASEGGDTNAVFCVNLSIHIAIAAMIFLLAESIGLWLLNAYINIPVGREAAANWVYQSVIISLCMTVISVPFSACIIAHERMSFYAFVSILDALMKLGIAFMIARYGGDRLILYGWLMLAISFINLLLFFLFCRIKYEETKYHFVRDKQRYKSVFKFVGWTMLGQSAIVGTNQGNNILINLFHGVTSNAAMSIGTQVNSAIVNLSSNFQTAFNPQITKSYASGDYKYLLFLISTTTKISFSLLFIVSLPILFNIDWVLSVWLGTVPHYANVFCVLCVINGILNALSAPLNFTVMASGRIRNFQIATSVVYLSDLIFVTIVFLMGMPAYMAMVVKVIIMFFVYGVRLYYAHKELECLNVGGYLKSVFLPVAVTALASILIAFFLMYFSSSIGGNVVATICFTALAFCIVYFVELNGSERDALKKLIVKKKH